MKWPEVIGRVVISSEHSQAALLYNPAGADSGQISEETWSFLQSIYGGGPLLTVRPSISHQEADSSHSEEKIEVETRSL